MPEKNNYVGAILSISSLIMFGAVFYFICTGEVKPANKDFFNIALMALIGWIGIAIGYYLGTSTSSAKKSETIDKLTTPPANATIKTDTEKRETVHTETKGVPDETIIPDSALPHSSGV